MGPDGAVYESETFIRISQKTPVTLYVILIFLIFPWLNLSQDSQKWVINLKQQLDFLKPDKVKQVELPVEPCRVDERHSGINMLLFDTRRLDFF